MASDSSGYNNTGTLRGGPTWATGAYGTAISLNGTTAYVTVNESASIELSSQMSVSFWVQSSSTPGIDQRIIGKLYDWEIKLNGRYPQLTAGGKYAQMSYALPAGSWQHVVFTFASGVVKGYVNGAPVSMAANTLTSGQVLPAYKYGLYIGTDAGRSYFLKGLLDDMRVYNRALTATEVSGIYSQTRH